MPELVLMKTEGAVAVLTLNRPEKLNALNYALNDRLLALLDQIEAESPHCAAWLAPLRGLAQRFEFDRMTPLIQDAIDRSQTA